MSSPCPLCGEIIPNRRLNAHVNACLDSTSRPSAGVRGAAVDFVSLDDKLLGRELKLPMLLSRVATLKPTVGVGGGGVGRRSLVEATGKLYLRISKGDLYVGEDSGDQSSIIGDLPSRGSKMCIIVAEFENQTLSSSPLMLTDALGRSSDGVAREAHLLEGTLDVGEYFGGAMITILMRECESSAAAALLSRRISLPSAPSKGREQDWPVIARFSFPLRSALSMKHAPPPSTPRRLHEEGHAFFSPREVASFDSDSKQPDSPRPTAAASLRLRDILSELRTQHTLHAGPNSCISPALTAGASFFSPKDRFGHGSDSDDSDSDAARKKPAYSQRLESQPSPSSLEGGGSGLFLASKRDVALEKLKLGFFWGSSFRSNDSESGIGGIVDPEVVEGPPEESNYLGVQSVRCSFQPFMSSMPSATSLRGDNRLSTQKMPSVPIVPKGNLCCLGGGGYRASGGKSGGFWASFFRGLFGSKAACCPPQDAVVSGAAATHGNPRGIDMVGVGTMKENDSPVQTGQVPTFQLCVHALYLPVIASAASCLGTHSSSVPSKQQQPWQQHLLRSPSRSSSTPSAVSRGSVEFPSSRSISSRTAAAAALPLCGVSIEGGALHRCALDGNLALLRSLYESCGGHPEMLLLRTPLSQAKASSAVTSSSDLPGVAPPRHAILSLGGLTVLDCACLYGRRAIVAWCLTKLQYIPSPRLSPGSGLHALHFAVLGRDAHILAMLVIATRAGSETGHHTLSSQERESDEDDEGDGNDDDESEDASEASWDGLGGVSSAAASTSLEAYKERRLHAARGHHPPPRGRRGRAQGAGTRFPAVTKDRVEAMLLNWLHEEASIPSSSFLIPPNHFEEASSDREPISLLRLLLQPPRPVSGEPGSMRQHLTCFSPHSSMVNNASGSSVASRSSRSRRPPDSGAASAASASLIDVKSGNAAGLTPLAIAILMNDVRMIRVLCSGGWARVSLRSDTVVHCGSKMPTFLIALAGGSIAAARLLLGISIQRWCSSEAAMAEEVQTKTTEEVGQVKDKCCIDEGGSAEVTATLDARISYLPSSARAADGCMRDIVSIERITLDAFLRAGPAGDASSPPQTPPASTEMLQQLPPFTIALQCVLKHATLEEAGGSNQSGWNATARKGLGPFGTIAARREASGRGAFKPQGVIRHLSASQLRRALLPLRLNEIISGSGERMCALEMLVKLFPAPSPTPTSASASITAATPSSGEADREGTLLDLLRCLCEAGVGFAPRSASSAVASSSAEGSSIPFHLASSHRKAAIEIAVERRHLAALRILLGLEDDRLYGALSAIPILPRPSGEEVGTLQDQLQSIQGLPAMQRERLLIVAAVFGWLPSRCLKVSVTAARIAVTSSSTSSNSSASTASLPPPSKALPATSDGGVDLEAERQTFHAERNRRLRGDAPNCCGLLGRFSSPLFNVASCKDALLQGATRNRETPEAIANLFERISILQRLMEVLYSKGAASSPSEVQEDFLDLQEPEYDTDLDC